MANKYYSLYATVLLIYLQYSGYTRTCLHNYYKGLGPSTCINFIMIMLLCIYHTTIYLLCRCLRLVKAVAMERFNFASSIRKKYKERLINVEKQWPPCHSDKLVRLELVERKNGEGYSANTQRGREDSGRGRKNENSREDKAVKQLPLAYGDLFKVGSGKRAVRKVLVEGDAGIGKTTLSLSVSEDWANGKLFQQFELVLLLPLRMKVVASAGSLPELLKLLHPSPSLCESVARYLEEEEGKSVLIIADGFDELSESNRQEGSFLYQLLFQLFPFLSVVVTSRPSASAPLHRLSCINRFVEVRGFSKEHIVEFIQSEFASDQEKASRLLEQLDNNPLIESVCSVPINCAIVCHLWRILEEALPTTMTKLYTKIFLNIILRNVQKKDAFKHIDSLPNFSALPQELQKSWALLCKFAFEAIVKDQIVFSQEELVDIFPHGLVDVLCFGLLQSAKTVLETGYGMSFHFLHLTFQEYLAALHLATLPSKEQQELFQRHHNFSAMVFRFFFGIFFSGMPRNDLDLRIVIKSLSREGLLALDAMLLCHCAFEAGNKSITENMIQRLGKSGGFDAAIKINDLDRLPLTNHPSTAHDCAAVLYAMSNMQECSMVITFSNSGVRENQIRTLTDILVYRSEKQVIQLHLSGNRLTDDCVADLFFRAPAAFSSLSELDLGSNAIGDESVESITRALERSQCDKLVKLDLSYNSLVLSGLQTLTCTGLLANLNFLFLQGAFTGTDQDSGPEQVTSFINALLKYCHCLKMLDISQNKFQINKSGASVLGKLMSRCKVVLLGLYSHPTIVDIHHPISDRLQIILSSTSLGDEGLSTFIKILDSQSQFSRLELQDNGISAKGVSCLADSVCRGEIVVQGDTFPEIYDEDGFPDPDIFLAEEMENVEFHLDCNPLGLEGTRIIGTMLGSGHCQVKTLSLEGCQLTTDLSNDSLNGSDNAVDNAAICEDIGKDLCQTPACTTITHLYLDHNRFTKEGVQILVGYISLCPTLRVLSTCFCTITSDDLSQLLDRLIQLKSSHPNLFDTLLAWHLSDNEINDTGISVLIKHLQTPSPFPYSKLSQRIYLQNNPISDNMMEKMEKELERRHKVRYCMGALLTILWVTAQMMHYTFSTDRLE